MHRMEEAVLELEPYDGSTRLKGPGAATLVDKQIALVEASTTAPGRSCESWSSRYLYCWCFGALVMLGVPEYWRTPGELPSLRYGVATQDYLDLRVHGAEA